MKIAYLPIEPYKERYTEFLWSWTLEKLSAYGTVLCVHPKNGTEVQTIGTGSILDPVRRAEYACAQMAKLAKVLPGLTSDDAIYLDDVFTPGYEAIPYILAQTHGPRDRWPLIVARCHAQSVDPDDFTFGFRDWMRPYEQLVSATADYLLVSSWVLRENLLIAGLAPRAEIAVVGHPFDSTTICGVAGRLVPWVERPRRVAYAARFDYEKQPWFLSQVADRLEDEAVEVVAFTGADEVKSNDPGCKAIIENAIERGVLTVRTGCTKTDYLSGLAECRVALNTSRQDWLSYALLDAAALGVPTVAPCFRSFPETLPPEQLYTPWHADEAAERVLAIVDAQLPKDTLREAMQPAIIHDQTLDRIGRLLRDRVLTEMPSRSPQVRVR